MIILIFDHMCACFFLNYLSDSDDQSKHRVNRMTEGILNFPLFLPSKREHF